ncbi:Neurofilament medium polypeptide protein [Madurella fahalii]|uniref:Neurofilament medium polypeptide protein n=1 Tax=Madurella fahalii TaxID=1157608 RepID=A0ABQ0G394_9PEZI
MQHVSFYLLAAWSAVAVASVNLEASIQSGFRMAMLAPRQTTNLQVFTGALGGAGASAITNSGDPERPFEVDGDTFPDYETAAIRACDNQKNVCADLANNGTGSFSVGECDQQTERCKSTATSAATKSFPAPVLVSSDDEFDYFC